MDADDLAGVPLFEGLSRGDLEECAARFDVREFVAGTSLVKQGDFSYRFFVVLDGELEVYRDFEHVADLGIGDFFGEMGVVEDERRNARVTPKTRCRLATMITWDFGAMRTAYPVVAERIDATIAARSGSTSGPTG